MSTVNSAYISSGLKGIIDLYGLFPERLREMIVKQHAVVFRQLWKELTEDERHSVNEYVLDGDLQRSTDQPTPEYYEQKLRDLTENYSTRRAVRLQEVVTYEPEVATALVLDFEKAHESLLQITRDLFQQAKERTVETERREQEALLFEPSEHSGLVTVSLN